MTTPLIPSLPPDELRLAQLACHKLAGLVEGALSIGLPSLVTGVPNPHEFLESRFRTLDGFALVLHAVAGPPGCQQEVLRLREKSGAVLAGLEALRELLLDASRQPGACPPPRVRELVSHVCTALDGYAELVGCDRVRLANLERTIEKIVDGAERLTPADAGAL